MKLSPDLRNYTASFADFTILADLQFSIYKIWKTSVLGPRWRLGNNPKT